MKAESTAMRSLDLNNNYIFNLWGYKNQAIFFNVVYNFYNQI